LITRTEINTFDGTSRICILLLFVYFKLFFRQDSSDFCSSCIIKMHDLFIHLYAIRQHVSQYIYIDSIYCKECRDLLYQILPYNLCPICTMWKIFNATMQKLYFLVTVWKLHFSDCEKQYILIRIKRVICKLLSWIREKSFLRGNNVAIISLNR